MNRISINGIGRIGRSFLRMAIDDPDIDIIAINDLGNIETIAYLLKYDSVYRNAFNEVTHNGKDIISINGKEIKYTSIAKPEECPWTDLKIDLVVESTGIFTSYEKAKGHLKGGARKVVISAPVKDNPVDVKGATILMGVNEDKLQGCDISSNASCTTNASAIPLKILNEEIGIEKAILNTVHAYTSSQNTVDLASKKNLRNGRAAAVNIIPTSTGAATAVTKTLPGLTNKFDGVAIRVPVAIGSIVDITFISKRDTTVKEINEALTKGANDKRFKEFFAVTDEEIVSSDIIGSKYAATADLLSTRVVDGNLVKIFCWYDNEVGYTHTLLSHIKKALGK